MPNLSDRLQLLVKQAVWKLRPEILLCPRVPKPMHTLAPRVVRGKEWWDRTRQAAYASTDYHCVACGVLKHQAKFHPWLEGHEVYEIDYCKGLCKYVETVPLCHACHCFIHLGRLEKLVANGSCSKQKFDEVVAHGLRVLDGTGLRRVDSYTGGPVADWGRWRLVIGGTKYRPKFKSYQAWCKKFGVAPGNGSNTNWMNP